jgi:phosphohistidine phosphatase
MKQLYIVRHAKSDWGNEFLQDIDRPLSQRGYEDAYRMAEHFKKTQKIPELIVSSPASRAINTAFIFARKFGINEKEVVIEKRIFEANESKLSELISELPDSKNTVMLFGHNPGLTNFINSVSDKEIDNLPTCGIVLLSYELKSWKKIYEQTAHFNSFYFPKQFRP